MVDTKTLAWLDQEDTKVAQIIRRYGWLIQYVSNDECDHPECHTEPDGGTPFAYTVGLFGLGHPELLILGVPRSAAMGILNDLGERIRSGEDLIPGQLITFSNWPHRIVPEVVPNPGQIVYAANRHYRRPSEHSVPVLQLSYDDKAGRFPWEDGYAAPDMQPRPGTYTA